MIVLLALSALADDGHVELRAGPMFAAGAPTLAAGARVVGDKDAWIGVEGRVGRDAGWIGRADAGVDLLGRSPLDLQVGAYVGGTGGGLALNPGLSVGGELAAGVTVWRLDARYRLVRGLNLSRLSDDVSQRHFSGFDAEDEVTVGVRLVDTLRVYGQYLRAVPATDAAWQAIGGGVSFSF